MEEIILTIVENFPNLFGLAILAAILYRQNEKLLAELFNKIDNLETRIARLEIVLDNQRDRAA